MQFGIKSLGIYSRHRAPITKLLAIDQLYSATVYGKPRQGFYISAPKKFLIAILLKLNAVQKLCTTTLVLIQKVKIIIQSLFKTKKRIK